MKSKNYLWGLTCIITYVIILAIQPLAFNKFDVRFHMDIFLLIFTVFVPTFLFFNLIHGKAYGKLIGKMRESSKKVFLLNFFTAMAWVPIILSWTFIDEAVANTISLGSGPILILIKSGLIDKKKVSGKDRLVAIGMAMVIGFLAFISINESNPQGKDDQWIGLLLALLSGIGVVGYLLVSRGMNKINWGAKDLMAVRFPMILLICGLILLAYPQKMDFKMEADHLSYELAFIFLLVVFMALPVYLVQMSIKLLRPMTVSVLIILSPLVTLVLKMANGQYDGFPLSIVIGVCLGVLLMIHHQIPVPLGTLRNLFRGSWGLKKR